jgi:mucin-5B
MQGSDLQLLLLLQTGETWAMPNCSQATCKGNQIVTLTPRQCPELKAPTCANGYPALKVYDKEGCCQHYQCQCETGGATGWAGTGKWNGWR